MAHALDVDRQRATLEALDADIREEAAVNQVCCVLVPLDMPVVPVVYRIS